MLSKFVCIINDINRIYFNEFLLKTINIREGETVKRNTTNQMKECIDIGLLFSAVTTL